MFYTNRRANTPGLEGVSWVHGSPIGIAESKDGRSWQYRQNAIFDAPFNGQTLWAPEVIQHNQHYYMFLTVVPGIFDTWSHPRNIVQFKSHDLIQWHYVQTLPLSNNKVIDAEVIAKPSGGFRMFYNNEKTGKSIYYADSPDLLAWQDKGEALAQKPGEGPVSFFWKNYFWLIVDSWNGLSVFRSKDLNHWQPQPHRLLEQAGTGPDDGVKGGHADVVVDKHRALIFYFTHPGRTPENKHLDNTATRRSVIQMAELEFIDGWLHCDRNKPVLEGLSTQ